MYRNILLVVICLGAIAHGDEYFVDSNNPSPVAPYTNWVTASTDIQSAVDAASAGDTIWVTNGQYMLTSEIAVSNAVTIQSVNGPEVTIVNAQSYGRCFNLSAAGSVLSGMTATNGYTLSSGGGIYCTSPTAVITNCVVSGNVALSSGGGIYSGQIYNSIISGNSASTSGGGVDSSSAENCLIINNRTTGVGDGSVFPPLPASHGGGAYFTTLENCTVCDNTSAGSAGGVYGGTIYNSIIYYNSASSDADTYLSLDYGSCGTDLDARLGNITNAPSFVDRLNDDYRLALGSPCIDSGISFYVESTSDLIGNPRIVNSNVDMGAYEYMHKSIMEISTRSLVVSLPSGMTSYTTNFSISNIGSSASTLVYEIATNVSWLSVSPASGSSTEEVNNITLDMDLSALGVGTHQGEIVITAPNAENSPQIIEVQLNLLANVIYVSAANGNDLSNGLSWDNAKSTIQAGVDAVEFSEGNVLVSNGVYNLTEEIVVDKSLTLQSVNGSEVTIVDAQWFSRCLTLDDYSIVVDGFTLRNGYADMEGGGAVYGSGNDASLINCVISDNISWDEGGGVYCPSGTLENCTLRDNQSWFGDAGGAMAYSAVNCLFERNIADGVGGGLYAEQSSGSTFRDNAAEYGGGMANGVASGCLFEGNSAASYGGGMNSGAASGCLFVSNSASYGGGTYSCDVTNCTIVGNSADSSGGGMYFGDARNSIIYGNTPDDLNTVVSVLYSCSPDLEQGTLGNITNNPSFADAAAGNYRLVSSSPCVDTGINAYSPGPIDLDHNPRIHNVRVDMGAYEYQGVIADADQDGLSDFAENQLGTNPFDSDSDDDGFEDGWEVIRGWNPSFYDADIVSYIDSNSSVFGYYTSESIGDLAMGEMMVGVSNANVNLQLQIMKSSDLITWTNAGSSVEWSTPATGKEFFRVRAEP